MKGSIDNIKEENFDLIIIDGMNYCYKFFYIHAHLEDKKGNQTGLIYGMVNHIYLLRKTYRKSKIIIAWDRFPTKKREIDEIYKANRLKEKPGNFNKQRDNLQDLLSLYNVYQCYADGYEADDVAAKIVKENYLKNSILIMSEDSDWLQNLKFRSVKVFKNKRIYNRQEIEMEKGIDVEKMTMFKSIVGEKKENLLGIPRIPKKMVWEWANTKTLDELFSLCKRVADPTRWAMAVIENEGMIRSNYKMKELLTSGYNIKWIERKKNKVKLLEELMKMDMNKMVERIEG